MSITIRIVRGSKVLDLVLSSETPPSVHDLCMAVESTTGVFARNQRLIFKGRVVTNEPPTTRLSQLSIADGSKVLLMAALTSTAPPTSTSTSIAAASQQLTRGQAMALDVKRQKQEEARVKIESMLKGQGGLLSGGQLGWSSSSSGIHPNACTSTDQWAERREGWFKTKIISLRGLGIDALPDDLLVPLLKKGLSSEGESTEPEGGASAADTLGLGTDQSSIDPQGPTGNGFKAADLSENRLRTLPPSIFKHMHGLRSLRLNHNQLGRDGPLTIRAWMDPLAMHLGPSLSRLDLGNNLLEIIPEAFFDRFERLQHVSLNDNRLTDLAEDSFEKLSHLETLSFARNRLGGLPSSIGFCTSLIGLDASSNLITSLPSSLSSIKGLQVLRLSVNRISALPPDLLFSLTQLHTLSCESNPLTPDQLRGTGGFEGYEIRRRAKVDKQIEGGAMFDARKSLAQGADQELYEKWK